MRVRIALVVLALAIIALLIWRMACEEGRPVVPVAPVAPPVDARPPDTLPIDAAPITQVETVPATAAAGGGERPSRGHRRAGPKEEVEPKERVEKVARAVPAPP